MHLVHVTVLALLLEERLDERAADLGGDVVGRLVGEPGPRLLDRTLAELEVRLALAAADVGVDLLALLAEALGEVADVEIAGAADAFTYLYGEVVQMVVGEYLVTVNTAGTDAADGSPYSTALAALVAPRL